MNQKFKIKTYPYSHMQTRQLKCYQNFMFNCKVNCCGFVINFIIIYAFMSLNCQVMKASEIVASTVLFDM